MPKNSTKQTLSDNYSKLAFEQFSELNATLYMTNPAEYFRTRLKSVALQLNPSTEFTEAAKAGVSYGVLRGQWSMPTDEQTRLRYVAMETTVLLHHAVETSIRAYMAHLGCPRCPWLEIARLNDYRKFKGLVRDLTQQRMAKWDRAALGEVFLGGKNPADAEVDISPEAWDAHLEAIMVLLVRLGSRLLDDAGLYNSAKHGLSGIVSPNLELGITLPDGRAGRLSGGPTIAYLKTVINPKNPPAQRFEWNLSLANVLIDSDLLTVELACKAIDSIWSVARRRYTGIGGHTWLLTRDYVEANLDQGRVSAHQEADSIDQRLATTSRDERTGRRRIGGLKLLLSMHKFQDDYRAKLESYDPEANTPQLIELTPRERDRRPEPTQKGSMIPIAPNGSQTDVDSATIVGDDEADFKNVNQGI